MKWNRARVAIFFFDLTEWLTEMALEERVMFQSRYYKFIYPSGIMKSRRNCSEMMARFRISLIVDRELLLSLLFLWIDVFNEMTKAIPGGREEREREKIFSVPLIDQSETRRTPYGNFNRVCLLLEGLLFLGGLTKKSASRGRVDNLVING